MSNVFANLQAESERQKQDIRQEPITITPKKAKTQSTTPNATQETPLSSTREVTSARAVSSENPREMSRDLPTRDAIQEFSFSLRDELKVKVQAEVPHQWQDELENIAHELKVKKLELYRYIIGEFLGKISRQRGTERTS